MTPMQRRITFDTDLRKDIIRGFHSGTLHTVAELIIQYYFDPIDLNGTSRLEPDQYHVALKSKHEGTTYWMYKPQKPGVVNNLDMARIETIIGDLASNGLLFATSQVKELRLEVGTASYERDDDREFVSQYVQRSCYGSADHLAHLMMLLPTEKLTTYIDNGFRTSDETRIEESEKRAVVADKRSRVSMRFTIGLAIASLVASIVSTYYQAKKTPIIVNPSSVKIIQQSFVEDSLTRSARFTAPKDTETVMIKK